MRLFTPCAIFMRVKVFYFMRLRLGSMEECVVNYFVTYRLQRLSEILSGEYIEWKVGAVSYVFWTRLLMERAEGCFVWRSARTQPAGHKQRACCITFLFSRGQRYDSTRRDFNERYFYWSRLQASYFLCNDQGVVICMNNCCNWANFSARY